MKFSLGMSNFLERSLVFRSLLFSSISLHWSLRKAFLSLLVILWNSAFRCLYLSFSPLLFTSLCTMSQTSVHHSSGTLSIRSSPLNLFGSQYVSNWFGGVFWGRDPTYFPIWIPNCPSGMILLSFLLEMSFLGLPIKKLFKNAKYQVLQIFFNL